MLKCTPLKIAASLCAFFLSTLVNAESFDHAIKNAETSGQFRLAYISVKPDVAAAKTNYGAAAGGYIKFETAEWNRFQFAIAPYFSEKIDALTGSSLTNESNGDFFTAGNNSFAYLGEAYINYAFSKGSLRIGRQQLDNPFINTDDIRMLTNTFSAAWLNTSVSDSINLEAGFVSQWAGIDSGGSQDLFKKAGIDGVSALGMNYKYSEELAVQGWYYLFNKSHSLLYMDADYLINNLALSAQYASFQETNGSNIAGNVFGISAGYEIDALTLTVAVNKASNTTNKIVDLGLGGGNFYASMGEMTIGGLSGASAHVITAGYAVSDNFTISIATGHFEDKNKATTNTNETNITLALYASKKSYIEFIHMLVDNKALPTDAGTNFSRNLLRISYQF